MEEKKLEVIHPEILSPQEAQQHQADVGQPASETAVPRFEFKVQTRRFPLVLALLAIPIALVLLKLVLVLVVFGFGGFVVWNAFRFARRNPEARTQRRLWRLKRKEAKLRWKMNRP